MIENLTPVPGSGTYYCEHKDCPVTQTEDVLFYGIDDGMFCRKHIIRHIDKVIVTIDQHANTPN